MGDTGRFLKSLLGRLTVPHIAFEIDDAGRAYEVFIEIFRRQVRTRAEIGVHRALAVRRYEDETAPRRRPLPRRRDVETDAHGENVMRESATNGVVLDLADIGALEAEGADADDRIGRRAAGDHRRRAHMVVESLGAVLVDEDHRAFLHFLGD